MSWLLLVACCALFVELFTRFGTLHRARQMNAIVRRAGRVIASRRISDHWKERALLRYSGSLFVSSLLMFATLLLALSPFAVAGAIASWLDEPFLPLLVSFKGIAASCAFAIVYAKARNSSSGRNYGFLSRVLHTLALGNMVAEVSFDIERAVHGKDPRGAMEDRHVFVCGLARAGTTILMRRLYATGCFRSLTYRDMPFVLAPNLWRSLSARSQKQGAEADRAHGDGMQHGYDSPEALEEVFWRVFCGKAYIRKDRLVPMRAEAETLESFRTYVALLLKEYDGNRYLSKNNNNILRLSSVAEAFPNAAILIPFREPLSHAHSLLAQHKRFLSVHAEDPFSLKYMQWLVHHEFGADHRPFVFAETDPLEGDLGQFDYWLHVWIHVYTHLLENLPAQASLVSYERFCLETTTLWRSLCGRVALDRDTPTDPLRAPNRTHAAPQNGSLVSQAAAIHEELLASSL